MTVEPRMKISPVSEFRPYLLRFTVSAAVGAVLGVVGAGFLLYFGIVILLILLGKIATTRDAKERVATWGVLVGMAVACLSTWSYLGLRF
jgi:hypothetical protein